VKTKDAGKNIRLAEFQTEYPNIMVAVWNVGACRISQNEGTEKSTSLFVSEVWRA
jgi:hypothetical protein